MHHLINTTPNPPKAELNKMLQTLCNHYKNKIRLLVLFLLSGIISFAQEKEVISTPKKDSTPVVTKKNRQ